MIQDGFIQVSITKKMLSELQRDEQFRNYHHNYREKLKLNFIRNTFVEMMADLQNHVRRLALGQMNDVFDETLTRKKKIWNYSQFKLFAWISVWIILRKQRSNPNSLSPQYQNDERFLCWLFPNKPQKVIAYEFQILKLKLGHQRNPWKEEEIQELINQVDMSKNGKNTATINWKLVSYRMYTLAGFVRATQECRERWCNHLSPSLKKNKWSIEQDIRLLQLVEENGTRWAKIAKIFVDRTEHMIKNRYRSLEKKMQKHQAEQGFNIKKAVSCLKRVHNLIEWNRKITHGKRNCPQSSEQDSLSLNCYEQSIDKHSANQTLIKTEHICSADQSQCSIVQARIYKIEQPTELQYLTHWSKQNYDWLDEMIEQRNNSWLEQY